MPIFKDLSTKRFWIGVLLALAAAMLVTALGAWLAVIGLVEPHHTYPVTGLAWAVAGLCAGIYAGRAKENRLLLGILTIGAAIAVLCCAGLTVPGQQEGRNGWWILITAALAGTTVGILLPQKRSRRGKLRPIPSKKR